MLLLKSFQASSKLLRRLGLVGRLDEARNFSVHHPPRPPVEFGWHDRHRLAGVILPVLLLRFSAKTSQFSLPSEVNEAVMYGKPYTRGRRARDIRRAAERANSAAAPQMAGTQV
jgi:hypothetical protein